MIIIILSISISLKSSFCCSNSGSRVHLITNVSTKKLISHREEKKLSSVSYQRNTKGRN